MDTEREKRRKRKKFKDYLDKLEKDSPIKEKSDFDAVAMWERITELMIGADCIPEDVAYYLFHSGNNILEGVPLHDALGLGGISGRGSKIAKRNQAREDDFLLRNANAMRSMGLLPGEVHERLADEIGKSVGSVKNSILRAKNRKKRIKTGPKKAPGEG